MTYVGVEPQVRAVTDHGVWGQLLPGFRTGVSVMSALGDSSVHMVVLTLVSLDQLAIMWPVIVRPGVLEMVANACKYCASFKRGEIPYYFPH